MRLSLFNNEDEPEVSMSPLIDCVFLLLIFFLVSTMTKVKNRDISVDLPTSESAIKLKPDDKQAIVGLDAEGNFYWDGQPCSTNFMMEQLRETCISDPGRRIRIDMEKESGSLKQSWTSGGGCIPILGFNWIGKSPFIRIKSYYMIG